MNTKSSGSSSMLPPGPPKLPLIGNLHLLVGTQPHRCLARLAQKYGPVMLLQLGEVSTVVISSPEAAKQVMKTHDSVFSERPFLYAAQFITYNFRDIVFARGDYRRQIRKICVLEMLSQKRVQSFRPIREEEISNLLRTISSKAGSPINLKNFLYSSTVNIFSRAAFGGKCKHQDAFKKLLPDIVVLFGGLSVVDVYPSAKLLHLINAMRPKNKKLHNKVDEILESIIQEHRATKLTTMTGESEVDDLVQVLLDIQDRGALEVPLSTSSIKAIILDIFLAGVETSSTVVEWAMSEMLRNPEVLKRAQAEVRHVFAGRRDVDESGIHELKYLRLVIKETLRLHPPAPLLLPRECQVNCEVNGCVIPAKSRIIINAWAIGQNQNNWTDAEKFYPERFCDSSINYKGGDFEFIPFGAGRRMCPGMSYGIAIVELILANLLYHFDWKLPNGKKPEDLDMTEHFRASLQRKDLCLVSIPHHL
ncbi:Cytochrome P450 [Theobroma cacao]|uniref:Cytochrome P450 n=1 Tax=Theobroma cacao TaxID=3641 RepID=A0A061FB26_THECC|nr:Cytochrome P450 [Theobroma cacao]